MRPIKAMARRHAIQHEGPAEDFFEGALLGNGGLGCVVTTRPDALALHFGHNDVWDVRVPDPPESQDDTFAKVMEKLLRFCRILPADGHPLPTMPSRPGQWRPAPRIFP